MSFEGAARLTDGISHSFAAEGEIAAEVVADVATAFLPELVGPARALKFGYEGASALLRWAVRKAALASRAYIRKLPATLGSKAIEAVGKKLGEQVEGIEGRIANGSPDVFTNLLCAARVDDPVTCDESQIAQGSECVSINLKPASRRLDKTKCEGTIVEASDNVYIGGPPAEASSKSKEHEAPLGEKVAGAGAAAVGGALAEGKSPAQAAVAGAKAIAKKLGTEGLSDAKKGITEDIQRGSGGEK